MITSALLLLLVPLLYALATLVLALPVARSRAGFTLHNRWRFAQGVAHLAPVVTASAALLQILHPSDLVTRYPSADQAASLLGGLGPHLSVRADTLSLVMLSLVTIVAMVITRFSERYLDGEPGQPRYQRAFMLTMTAVSLLVITNNLFVLVAAWSVSSVSLHQLLTFYSDRPAALVAAHKKFLMSRLADFLLFGAVTLLYLGFQTVEIDAILLRAQAGDGIPGSVELAGALLACGVILRSAQLPFHGWLIQVMEAPTPVSALLHAGIVNIGGFVLIRLGGLLVDLQVAQTLLVVVGALTATLAALVMTTRVSVKVELAWSTCAQMGFMLMECGLGAYDLALLHLVAHSLYKAHAFLSSGRTVTTVVVARMGTAQVAPNVRSWLLALGAAVPSVLLMDRLLESGLASNPQGWSAGFIVALALTAVWVRALAAQSLTAAVRLVALGTGGLLLYLVLHRVFGLALTDTPHASFDAASVGRALFVLILFAVSFGLHAALRAAPHGAFARRLYPAVFAGFYLDDIFTRMTFALWPPRSRGGSTTPVTLESSSSIGSVA